MKKAIQFGLMLICLAIAPVLLADALAKVVGVSTSTAPIYFQVKSGTTAVTYTASSIAGPGILLKKIYILPSALTATAVNVDLWDTGPLVADGTQNGLTSTANANKLFSFNTYAVATTNPFIVTLDLTTPSSGPVNAENGIRIKGFPAIISAGTVSPTVSIQYLPLYIQNQLQ